MSELTQKLTGVFEMPSEVGEDPLYRAVFTALGAASMCWESPSAAGEFNSARCGEVGEALIAWLRAHPEVALPVGPAREQVAD